MAGLKSYSAARDGNTELMPEEQTPGSVNDGVRQIQADMAADYRDREWTEYGRGDGAGSGSADYDCSYASDASFEIGGGDHTAAYHVGRAVRVVGQATGTIYGTITGASYDSDSNSTVVALSSTSSIVAETGLRVWIATLGGDGRALSQGALDNRPIDMGGRALSAPSIEDYGETRQTLAILAGAVTWDLSDGNVAYLSLTENVTSITISGWRASPVCSGALLIVQQDGTGGRTVGGWPAAVAWLGGSAPTVTPDAYAVDTISFLTIDGGAHVIGNFGQAALFAAAIG